MTTNTFFVLRNTQSGKSKITLNALMEWVGEKVIAFLIVDNDKTLADQTVQGLGENDQPILLSSSVKGTTVWDIRKRVDEYAKDADNHKMPVVVALNNRHQMAKVVKVMHYIKTKKTGMRYGVIFDEADKVYPAVRDREFPVAGGGKKTVKTMLEDAFRIGFVTATEGDLLEDEDCANAALNTDHETSPDYRGPHTADAVIQTNDLDEGETNATYAERILTDNAAYFLQPIEGTQYYRKTIVNGVARVKAMDALAMKQREAGAYAITLNKNGVTLYRPGKPKMRKSVAGQRLCVALYEIYRKQELSDRPLFIIGCRKVARGLGFHCAPLDGSEGLVWTDMVLGRIRNKAMAVQKAGRLAGIVAQCPQYMGQLTWWTDEKTAKRVIDHNRSVDEANTKKNCTLAEALVQSEDE